MRVLQKNDSAILPLADCLRAGGLAIVPTDTVYGFSGVVDVTDAPYRFKTDERIRRIKGREGSKPFIHLLAEPEDVLRYASEPIPDSLLSLWPGALTLIVSVRPDSPLADSGATVAFRCPGDSWLRSLIATCGAPLYSTSVNRSGAAVLEHISDIEREFGSDVDMIVADGDREGSLPSTIVSVADGGIRIVRQGAVSVAALLPS